MAVGLQPDAFQAAKTMVHATRIVRPRPEALRAYLPSYERSVTHPLSLPLLAAKKQQQKEPALARARFMHPLAHAPMIYVAYII